MNPKKGANFRYSGRGGPLLHSKNYVMGNVNTMGINNVPQEGNLFLQKLTYTCIVWYITYIHIDAAKIEIGAQDVPSYYDYVE